MLGYGVQPSMHFFTATKETSFMPTANTCSNRLNIPRPSAEMPLPEKDQLFGYYDYAFCNTYFGTI